jgi:hypothetical protein
MRKRGKARSKQSGSNEEPMFLNMGDEGGLIWQSRSKHIVIFLSPLLII